MRIRDARPADAEAVREVHATSITELGTQAYTREQVEAWALGCESADYMAAIEAEEMEFVVADPVDPGSDGEAAGPEDRVVGFGSLKLAAPEGYETAADAEVTGVYVHPSVARDGVGTRIYGELEERAREAGVGTLVLGASRNAVPFYEAHGYERVRAFDHEFSAHESTGVTGTIVEMAKDL